MSDISVAMCTFNGEDFVKDQLESLRSQTIRPTEIVINDDGSTDNTLEIARDFAASATIPVHIEVNKQRLGYRANFMRAASRCSGDVIAFCDQDDFWLPEKLRFASEALANDSVSVYSHNYFIADRSLAVAGTALPEGADTRLVKPLSKNPWDFPLGFSIVFRRALVQYNNLRALVVDPYAPGEHLAHDQWIPILGGALGDSAYDARALVRYRQHGRNAFGRNFVSGAKAPLIERLHERATRFSDYALLSDVSMGLRDVFASISGLQARKAERLYQDLSSAYSLRAQCYTAPKLAKRISAWRELSERGLYNHHHELQFVNKARARDLLLGAISPPFVRELIGSRYDQDNSLRVDGSLPPVRLDGPAKRPMTEKVGVGPLFDY